MAGHGQGRPAGAAARSKGATGGWEAFRRCYLRIFWGGTKVVIVAFERMWLKFTHITHSLSTLHYLHMPQSSTHPPKKSATSRTHALSEEHQARHRARYQWRRIPASKRKLGALCACPKASVGGWPARAPLAVLRVRRGHRILRMVDLQLSRVGCLVCVQCVHSFAAA